MKDRTFLPLPLFLASAALFLSISVLPAPAHAGFQWVAPAAPIAPPAPVMIPSAPMMADTAPMVIQSPVATQAPMVVTSPQPLPQPMQVMPMASEVSPAMMDDGKLLHGFANNVPLEVALRQILPTDYNFAFADGVDGSTLVSWQGGSPWRQTLQDVLRDANLGAMEQGKTMTIVHANTQMGAMAPVPVAPVQPMLQDNQPMALLSPAAQPMPLDTSASVVDMSNEPVAETWSANQEDSLRKVLEDWCRRANIQLAWQAEYDYPLQANVSLTGTFEDAVRRLLSGFQEAQPQPVAELHKTGDSSTQPVLVVQARGNNYSD